MPRPATLPRNDTGITTALGLLARRFGDRFGTGADLCRQHGHTTTWLENQPPDAVVFPRSTEEVAEIVQICAEHRVPVIAFGTGTSLEGHLNAPAGGAINAYSKLDLPETPLLLLEFHGTEAGVSEQAEMFRALVGEAGATACEWSTAPDERGRPWRARHDAYWALQALRPGAHALSTDVCVPISRLAEMVRATNEKARETSITAPILGHAGDGNFHAIFLLDPADPSEVPRAEAMIDWMSETAIAMEGTVTGEHGIGQGKAAFLPRELGEATGVMRAIKAALDPHGILNPGKILPRAIRA